MRLSESLDTRPLPPGTLEAMSEFLFPGHGESLDPAEGWFTAHCDGGSRGNPGPAGYGAVIEDPQGRIVARLSEFLGSQTNNYAEYAGLLAVLTWAKRKRHKTSARRLRLRTDGQADERAIQSRQPRPAPPVGRGQTPCRDALSALRCATPSAAVTRKPTGLPTKPWIREWADSQGTVRPASNGKRRGCITTPPSLQIRPNRPPRSSMAMSKGESCICSKVISPTVLSLRSSDDRSYPPLAPRHPSYLELPIDPAPL